MASFSYVFNISEPKLTQLVYIVLEVPVVQNKLYLRGVSSL